MRQRILFLFFPFCLPGELRKTLAESGRTQLQPQFHPLKHTRLTTRGATTTCPLRSILPPSPAHGPQHPQMLEDDTSTDFDDLDLGIDYDDPTLYSQLDSYAVLPTPAPPPLAKRPFVAPPRPAQAILRPAQPPAKKQRVEGPPRVERVAPKSGGAGRQSAGWVAREEEEMPEIRVEEGGYVRREGQGVTAIKRWGEGTGPPKVASPKGKERVREVLAGTSGLADDEKRELEALRAEKAAVGACSCVLALGDEADWYCSYKSLSKRRRGRWKWSRPMSRTRQARSALSADDSRRFALLSLPVSRPLLTPSPAGGEGVHFSDRRDAHSQTQPRRKTRSQGQGVPARAGESQSRDCVPRALPPPTSAQPELTFSTATRDRNLCPASNGLSMVVLLPRSRQLFRSWIRKHGSPTCAFDVGGES